MDKTKIFHWICCFTKKCHITKIKCDISFKIIDFQYSAILKLEKWHAVLLTRKYKSLRSVKSLSTCEYKQIPEEHQCFFVLTLCLAHINNLSPSFHECVRELNSTFEKWMIYDPTRFSMPFLRGKIIKNNSLDKWSLQMLYTYL